MTFSILCLWNLQGIEYDSYFMFCIFFPFIPTHMYWRTGRNGSISVRALDGPKASIVPSTYHSVSPPGYTILDVDANAMLFVGGLTGKIKVTSFSPSFPSSLQIPKRRCGERWAENSCPCFLSLCLWNRPFKELSVLMFYFSLICFIFFFFSWGMVLQCSQGLLETCNPPVWAFQLLWWQACVVTPNRTSIFDLWTFKSGSAIFLNLR